MVGSERLRGLYEIQAEIMLLVWGRIVSIIFIACGQIACKLGQLDISQPLTARGTGLRYVIDQEQKANAHFVFTWSQEYTKNLHFQVGGFLKPK